MSSVSEVLGELRRRPGRRYYRPSPGNAGDALIAAGFYHLAERLDLPFTELPDGALDPAGPTADDVLILAGGGWLTSHWDFGAPALTALTRLDASLVLLPQSLSGNADALRRLRPRDVLFVRERYSLAYARSLDLRCRVLLDHDLALHVDPRPLLAAPGSRATRLRPTGLPSTGLPSTGLSSIRPGRLPRRRELERSVALGYHRLAARRGGMLRAWRVDAEASGAHPGARWRDDLSLVANHGVLDRDSALRSASTLLRALARYERVETDRLHIGIGAALLGRPVRLHANAYHKIRGIYEYSLRDDPRFGPLVEFVDGGEQGTGSGGFAGAAADATAADDAPTRSVEARVSGAGGDARPPTAAGARDH